MDISHLTKSAYRDVIAGMVVESGAVAGAIVLVDADKNVEAVLTGIGAAKPLIAGAMRGAADAISTPLDVVSLDVVSLVEQLRPTPHSQLWDRDHAVPAN